MKAQLTTDRGGGIKLFACIHHLNLLTQYLGCNKGISLILRNGDEVDLVNQPRVGEYIWETANGPINSSDIEEIIDRSNHGYH